jgi:ABC-2 type transport system permease protein
MMVQAPPDLTYDSDARLAPVRQAFVDLYRYRGLLWLLVIRNLTVRYKRSLLGVTWTVINPLLTSAVYWLVFSSIFDSKVHYYVAYLVSGVLVVLYFQQGVQMSGASMVSSAGILTKVYAPPVVFALAAASAGALNFIFGLVPLALIQVAIGIGIPWTIILAPIPLLFLLALVAGCGLLIAVLAIQFNDVFDLTNVLLFLLSYLTPTFYVLTIIKNVTLRHLFILNPLYSFVNVFRALEGVGGHGGSLGAGIYWAVVVGSGIGGLLFGLTVFVRRWPSLAALL